jgi:hypothetical protein
MTAQTRRTQLIGVLFVFLFATIINACARSVPTQSPGMPDISEALKQMPQGMGTMPGVRMPDQTDRKSAATGPRPPGVPVPKSSPLFAAFTALDRQSAYRVRMSAVSDNPEFKRMTANGMGVGAIDIVVVRPDTRQVTMHLRMPATDMPGTIDDWEIRAVSTNGRAARLITSPAVPRYLKLGEEKLTEQMAMLDMQASVAVAQSLTEGPLGMAHAAYISGMAAMAHLNAVRLQQKAKDFFSWQCVPPDQGDHKTADRNAPTLLTDLKLLGDGTAEGAPVTTYEFYVKDGEAYHGPLRLLVAKSTGLPFRVEMTEPQAGGGMRMDYYDIDKPVAVTLPACLTSNP